MIPSKKARKLTITNKLKPLKFQGQSLTDHRRVIFRQFHNFGESMGEHLVEISMCKLKFYILIVEMAKGRRIPHLIELYIPQAKRLFNHCHKSYRELLELVEYKFGKFQMIDINKVLCESIEIYFNKPKHSAVTVKTSFPSSTCHRDKASLNNSVYQNRGYGRAKAVESTRHMQRREKRFENTFFHQKQFDSPLLKSLETVCLEDSIEKVRNKNENSLPKI
uniref:Uncharacterized protein n=1 Tax=Euplotes harpa TaxID=151035 RepID=A0A7S3NA17_9SPIT|mmetsp:Transcript_28186/g.32294  ORF Transcript_28186/g.32294 Transcript_28186/m.32294 type:complete len:221 (+) Transcript_28186:336-998(+)